MIRVTLAEEDTISQDYPIGSMIEPWDIEVERMLVEETKS